MIMVARANALAATGFGKDFFIAHKKTRRSGFLKTIATSCRQPSWLMVDHP
jgi:hypothetical protein